MSDDALLAPPDPDGRRQISPTEVAQFIRLEQCERYLRLRLHQRSGNRRFLPDYGVAPQALPPLLTRAGAAFETRVEATVAAQGATLNLAAASADAGQRSHDNARVLDLARDLPAGETLTLFQPRLEVAIGDWVLRGDLDVLRLERRPDGALHALIADIKSSRAARVEHRLQVAFYAEMLDALFAGAAVTLAEAAMAILYQGPRHDANLSAEERAEQDAQRRAAARAFGIDDGLLEIVADAAGYRGAVRDLVTGPDSAAARIAAAPFAAIPHHLSAKCDGCLYNEFCMKWAVEHDDLSLLPHLTANEKGALLGAGVRTMRQLATLRDEGMRGSGDEEKGQSQAPISSSPHPLIPSSPNPPIPSSPNPPIAHTLAATWPIGPRLEELVARARRYRQFKGDKVDAPPFIPGAGYGSLPYCDAEHNPNLVRVYLDAQHDYLQDRVYLLGALVVGCEGGEERAERRRSIVRLSSGPPDAPEAERDLLLAWIRETVQAIAAVAAPGAEGRAEAPIHLIFYDRSDQRVLLDALARHLTAIMGTTPLYDFLTQLAAFDSPIATFLDQEIRELKNYPMVCQSLQAVAAYRKFDWNAGLRYRDIFRARLFDFWGKLDAPPEGESPWYTSRARFGSQVPLEYAYAAWGELPAPTRGQDDYAAYRRATPDLLRGFQARRLEALEHVARDFTGNRQTEKRPFVLPNLATFSEKAHTLAQALDEFVTIERHVTLNAWKSARLAPPERRMLAGDTLVVRYDESDQDPAMAEQNRDHARRQELRAQYVAEWRLAHPDAERATLTKAQQGEARWSSEGVRLHLRLETDGIDCSLDEALGLTTLRAGDTVVIAPRTMVDSRLPDAEQTPITPTPKRLLYGTRGEIVDLVVQRDAAGKATSAFADVALRASRGGAWSRGFVFGAMEQPFQPGERYTLDVDPNDWYGYYCSKVTAALGAVLPDTPTGNRLYDMLAANGTAEPGGMPWPPAAEAGQQRFLAGLDALGQAGHFHAFEASKREFIGQHGGTPALLVQGPPGTGKSYATAFAVFARLQGALAADQDFRVLLSCKTHAATDVLLQNVRDVREQLRLWAGRYPDLFARYFDRRLLDIPLYRLRPRQPPPDGVIPLARHAELPKGSPKPIDDIGRQRWCIVAGAPAGVYGAIGERWPDSLLGHGIVDCLVLDEASQMNLPEAIMAALPLKADGRLIVVGDHRQMPPIVQHDWKNELRRTFQEYRAYESLFLTLLPRAIAGGLPIIRFAESFRLHAAMAEFLRREIYRQDDIPFFSHNRKALPPFAHPDPYVAAVLASHHPIVVVVHDEAQSQVRNAFEQALVAPVLQALADPAMYRLDPEHGLGVVVPHRAQRAALREAVPCLSRLDPATGAVLVSAVDTVERFQGSEREAILVSATESDKEFLLASGEFLLDPRRLTVALSRAKKKMILVAAQSVFTLFSADEATFANAQLWKNLLRHTCTVLVWRGQREGHQVAVWGNGNMPGD